MGNQALDPEEVLRNNPHPHVKKMQYIFFKISLLIFIFHVGESFSMILAKSIPITINRVRTQTLSPEGTIFK